MRSCFVLGAALLMAAPALATGVYPGAGGSVPDAAYDGTLGSMFSSTITVPAGEPDGDIITDIYVEIDIDHTWVGDLVFKLEGPAGLITLMSRPGLLEPADDGTDCCGNSSDLVAGNVQTFIDSAVLSAENIGLNAVGGIIPAQSVYPDGGINGPMSLLGTYAGTSAVGDWSLYIGDSAAGDLGTLGSWSLHLTTTPEPGSLGLLALGGLALLRRR